MEELRIHLLGGAEIYRGDTLLPPFPTQKSLSLFAYLVLHRGRRVHRDTVCGQFWGEQSDIEARKALRTCLWRIRSVVEPLASQRGTCVHVEGSLIRFAAGPEIFVDAWEFEDLIRAPARSDRADRADAEKLARAVSLYRGGFLEGVHEDWCFLHRERLRVAYLNALERLIADHAGHGRWLDVIDLASEALREDSLREHLHRALMEAHVAMGDRGSALRQYERCVETLREELDIEPMDQTRQLHESIRSASRPPRAHSSSHGTEVEGDPGVDADVDRALAALYALAERLERARNPAPSPQTPPGVQTLPSGRPVVPARRRRPNSYVPPGVAAET